MKIVVLDGFTLNPGDLSWDGLGELGDLTVYDYTVFDKAVERAAGAGLVFTNKTPLGRKELDGLPGLKYIGVLATGYNVVDLEAAGEKGVVVTNIPAYGTASVAQMVFALILELASHVQRHSDSVFDGKWSACRDFCYWDYPMIELKDKTIGIVGFGRIGQNVADIAAAFGMRVVACDSAVTDQQARRDFRWVEMSELMEVSDVVSLHCPLFPETKGMINKDMLGRMKKTAFLINTARGPLIVEEDLARALNDGVIAGAGLDVLSVEPPEADNPLLSAKNCVITPHISWATLEARSRLMDIAVNNAREYLAGNPVNVVNRL